MFEARQAPANGILFLLLNYEGKMEKGTHQFIGTGFLSDSGVFYTAGHCLAPTDDAGFGLDQVLVAMHQTQPFGTGPQAAYLAGDTLFTAQLHAGRLHNRYVLAGGNAFDAVADSTDVDWAAMLPPPRALSGTPRFPLYASEPKPGDTLFLYGYPRIRVQDEGCLYTATALISAVDETKIEFIGFSMPGFSGGPMLVYKNGRYQAIGVLCRGNAKEVVGTGRRITPRLQAEALHHMQMRGLYRIGE